MRTTPANETQSTQTHNQSSNLANQTACTCAQYATTCSYCQKTRKSRELFNEQMNTLISFNTDQSGARHNNSAGLVEQPADLIIYHDICQLIMEIHAKFINLAEQPNANLDLLAKHLSTINNTIKNPSPKNLDDYKKLTNTYIEEANPFGKISIGITGKILGFTMLALGAALTAVSLFAFFTGFAGIGAVLGTALTFSGAVMLGIGLGTFLTTCIQEINSHCKNISDEKLDQFNFAYGTLPKLQGCLEKLNAANNSSEKVNPFSNLTFFKSQIKNKNDVASTPENNTKANLP